MVRKPRLRQKALTTEPGEVLNRLRYKGTVQTKTLLAAPCCDACAHGDCCETAEARAALAVLDARSDIAPPGYSVKFAPNTFALDSPVLGEYKFSDRDLSVEYIFAASQSRDREGDFMEIGPTPGGEGILTANHERNAVAYVEHGQKFFALPIGYDRVRQGDAFTGPYTVILDPERGLASCRTFLTQSRPEGEQIFHMYKEGLLRGGSIGYRPIKSVRLAPDPSDGHFTDAKKGHAGLHLLTVELLETTLTGMPMNADAVRRSIEMGCCGRPLAPGLKSMLVAKAAAAPIWSQGGWEGKSATLTTAAPPAPHKFASTHFALPEPHASHVRQLAAAIPDADLAEDGRCAEPHITCRYGLHTDDPAEVIEAARGIGPVLVTLGETSIFPATDTAPYDVVKIDVRGYFLRCLHHLLGRKLENTRTHPRFRPHVTIATVQPGKGAAYVGPNALTGTTLLLDRLIFSDKGGTQTEIPLTGGVTGRRSLVDAIVAKKAFDERLHPRGQPENAGQFGR